MELTEIAHNLEFIFQYLDMRWEGYDVERITEEDFQVTIAAIIDYLDGVEDGPVTIELPNTHLKVERNEEGEHHVWLHVGEVDVDSIPDE